MIRKVSVEDLEPGMEVVQLSSELWEHMPNLYTRPGPIESREQVEVLLREGFSHAFVRLDAGDDRSAEDRLDRLVAERTFSPPIRPRVAFEKEIQVAAMAYENAMVHARRIITDVKMGRKVDYEASLETVGDIVESAVRNPDTLVCLSKLSTYDEYTYAHCINVATISVVFGEYLGMGNDELINLGVAGMMHDLGKTAVPSRIINKRARLTDQEFDEVKRHPEYGCRILEKNGDVPEEVLEAVRHHHEKYNGAGYPEHRVKRDISPLARIISLADVYDALTSDRSYKDAILPNKALAIMYGMREQDFDPMEVQLFIKCLGIFPAGSLVKLNNGAYGVVYESNPALPLLPKIKIILDEDLHPIPSELVDLAAEQALGHANLEILECADPSAYKINLKPYLTRKR
ncbi:HD-GYP domain-containing protein [Pseudodesulfovibrio sp.]|uniref:HD-GYP domain-containing protein n=1 Tax=Pseudodesulfovibrio sp. TaxID=2035812 RepID=UPI00262129A9|nr:HD-GYP domain-containing protein [Pseudodesulfovibrio sp.]MDD3311128.1 HD-GYP domain-containing protein [Pseudodesulfovibrio sp.]